MSQQDNFRRVQKKDRQTPSPKRVLIKPNSRLGKFLNHPIMQALRKIYEQIRLWLRPVKRYWRKYSL
ncbi:MAG: hypothetical protein FWF42_01400, partial [Streptococcaceae bacterium]|nr:hypothetical protein [Streptococcaceae bacterium]